MKFGVSILKFLFGGFPVKFGVSLFWCFYLDVFQ